MNTKKLSAGAVGGAVGVVLCYGFGFVPAIANAGGIPAEVGAAVGAIMTFVASVLIPDEVEE